MTLPNTIKRTRIFPIAGFIYLCFIAFLTLSTIVGTDGLNFKILLKAFASNLAYASLLSLFVLPLTVIIGLFSEKASRWFTIITFSVLILIETSLTIYTAHNGTILGSELLIRPIEETLVTIRGAMGITIPILTIVGGMVFLSWLIYFIYKRFKSKIVEIVVLALVIFSPLLTFIIEQTTKDISVKDIATFKSWRSLSDDFNFLFGEQTDSDAVEYNPELIRCFLDDHPDFQIVDSLYPLERLDNTPNVLAPFFNDCDSAPDIVMILVESLGTEFMEPCFAKYIDSLAHKGLYWKNCLSTTTRSFGAIPAITGSLVGPKSFQFGNMPKHNSLITILKKNNYQTNAFYGGDYAFDCIQEFLTAQHIDYLSPFWKEYRTSGKKEEGTWWGYHDNVLFDKSLDVIKGQQDKTAFSLFTTLSTHEGLRLGDKQMQTYYTDATDDIINRLPESLRDVPSKNRLRYASMVYADDCIRKFMNEYSKLPRFCNTIFIITGDHASGMNANHNIDLNHVPLIIWSPLLKQSKQFESIVTHNDIVPSIVSLLRNKCGLTTPETVHWISNGLDTTDNVSLANPMPLVTYDRHIIELIRHNYFYIKELDWENPYIAKFDQNLKLEYVNNAKLSEELTNKLEAYKYIYRYTYLNDKLIRKPLFNKTQNKVIGEHRHKRKIVCETPEGKPSAEGVRTYPLMPETTIESGTASNHIRLSLNADILLNDSLKGIDNYMELVFKCTNGSETTKFSDKVVKFIKEEYFRPNTEYKIELSKDFIINPEVDSEVSIFIATVMYDEEWVPNSKMTVRNVVSKVECIY